MTVLDFLKSKTAEEIAEEAEKCNSQLSLGLDMSNYFDGSNDCFEHNCEYLRTDFYDGEFEFGACNKIFDDCPYNVDRREVSKRKIIEWLNTEMKGLV